MRIQASDINDDRETSARILNGPDGVDVKVIIGGRPGGAVSVAEVGEPGASFR
ncbi:MAG: hypothetical protein R3B54_07765 [Bdellovibrionota bacterium]